MTRPSQPNLMERQETTRGLVETEGAEAELEMARMFLK